MSPLGSKVWILQDTAVGHLLVVGKTLQNRGMGIVAFLKIDKGHRDPTTRAQEKGPFGVVRSGLVRNMISLCFGSVSLVRELNLIQGAHVGLIRS